MKIYTVYVLESQKDRHYYIGVTSNLDKRIREHNSGLSKSTRIRKPWRLVYSERYEDIQKAYRREKYLKSIKKRHYLRKIMDNLPR